MPEFVINAANAGDNTLVSGTAKRRIRVTSYVLQPDAAVAATFKSGTGGVGSTALTGPMKLSTAGVYPGFSPGPMPGGGFLGWFTTANQGEDLILNLGAAVQVSGHGTYEYVS